MSKLPSKDWGKGAWHRKAARPVSVWMMVFLLAGLGHILIPEYRWVLIHIFTLGIVTNSIVLWSQSLTEKFLQQKQPDDARPAQLLRTRILNVGIVITIAGEIAVQWWDRHWVLMQIGATIIIVAITWHAVVLGQQWLRADKTKRFRPAVFGYILSAVCLPLGGIMGALLAMELPDNWHAQTLMAHMVINLAGFVGLAAAASLTVLFPSIWRVNGLRDRSITLLSLLTVGVVVIVVGALCDSGMIAGLGLAVYAAGWIIALQAWLTNVFRVLKDPRDRLNYPSLSVLLAVIWLIATIVAYAVRIFLAGEHIYQVSLPTMPLLLGFAAQLLLGVMSYLLPTTMGGGPGATRAGMKELNRAGIFRVVAFNMSFILWQVSTYSWLKVILSVVVFGTLAAFVPLMIRSVKAQKAVLMKQAEPPAPAASTPWSQATAAVAILGFILALFGGLHGPSAGTSAVAPTGEEDTQVIELTSPGMLFEPDLIEVSAGDHVVLNYTNTDSQAHDLRLDNGVESGRIQPGETARLDLGVVLEDIDGWCTIAGHEMQGMTFKVVAVE